MSRRPFAALWIGVSLLVLYALPAHAQAPAPEDIASGKVCAKCHEDRLGIWQTKHGVKGDARTPASSGGCVACHGDVTEHLKDPLKAKPRTFEREEAAAERSAVCLTCHQSGARIHWQGGPHDRNDIACTDCHKPHAARDQVLVKETQAGVCFTCHKDKRAELFRPSRHPLREGRMACSDCHQPHGSAGPNNLVRNSVNETCYTCHAEKRGPFLWEHPPAREECTNCHTPHGSVHAPMLKARAPYLCQQCHLAQFHPSTAYSGSNLPPNVAADKMLGQSCMNCHSKIHGSNHPSGARFTR